MSSKKRSKNKRYMRDMKIKKRGSAVHTRRTPKAQKRWDKQVGYAKRMLQRIKYHRAVSTAK